MGIVFDELKNGRFVVRESVTEMIIGAAGTFAEYVDLMQRSFLSPTEGTDQEACEAYFETPEDKRLIALYFERCEMCGHHKRLCTCGQYNGDRAWLAAKFPHLASFGQPR